MFRWLFPLALVFGCHGSQSAQTNPAPPGSAEVTAGQNAAPVLPQGQVVIRTRTGPVPFTVELALDGSSRERGLMFRRSVPEGTGMLFVFAEEEPHAFWMKNTVSALDMIFLSSERRVVGIVENAEPLTTTSRDPNVPSQYVLEVAAGTSFSRGIRVGDQAEFEGVPTL